MINRKIKNMISLLVCITMLFEGSIFSVFAKNNEEEGFTVIEQTKDNYPAEETEYSEMIKHSEETVLSENTGTGRKNTDSCDTVGLTLESNQFLADYIIYEVISEADATVKVAGCDRRAIYEKAFGIEDASFDGPLSITIPSSVSNAGKNYKVKEIGEFAFADYTYENRYDNTPNVGDVSAGEGYYESALEIKEITLSEGIEKISEGAFYRAFQLKRVNLPDSVREIGKSAFYFTRTEREGFEENDRWCTINHLPANLKRIGKYAFKNVDFGGYLKLPEGVEEIGDYAFCDDTEYYDDFASDGYGSGKTPELKEIDLPASLKKTGRDTFKNNFLLKCVIRANDITGYDYDTFGNGNFEYEKLTNLTIYAEDSVKDDIFNKFRFNVKDLKVLSLADYETHTKEWVKLKQDGKETDKLVIQNGEDAEFQIELSDGLTVDNLTVSLTKTDLMDFSYEETEPADYLGFEIKDDKFIFHSKALCDALLLIKSGSNTLGSFKVSVEGRPYKNILIMSSLEKLTPAELTRYGSISEGFKKNDEYAFILDTAKKITKGCSTAKEKAKAVKDWLSSYVIYDETAFEEGAGTNITPSDVIKNRYTVCTGYALSAEAMLRSLNIPCVYISGTANSDGHAWNAYYDDSENKWQLFDATWDAHGVLSRYYNKPYTGAAGQDYFDANDIMTVDRFFKDCDGAEAAFEKYYGDYDTEMVTVFEGETGKITGTRKDAVYTLNLDEASIGGGFSADEIMDYSIAGNEISFTGKMTGWVNAALICEYTENGIMHHEIRGVSVRVLPKKELNFKSEKYNVGFKDNDINILSCKYDGTGDSAEISSYVVMESSDTDILSFEYEEGILKMLPKKAGKVTVTAHLPYDGTSKLNASCQLVVLDNTLEFTDASGLYEYRIIKTPSGSENGQVELITYFNEKRKLEPDKKWTLTLPTTVINPADNKSYDVTGIGYKAFFVRATCDMNQYDNRTERLSMLDNCERIVLPQKLKYVDDYAFSGVSSYITDGLSIEFPETLERIGEYSFAYNMSLNEADLSKCTKLKEVEMGAFFNCEELAFNPESFSTTVLSGLKKVSLPEGLEKIGNGAFDSCPIESINFPESLKIIDRGAFNKSGISGNVVLNKNLRQIGEYAFDSCDNLRSVTFTGDTIDSIGIGLVGWFNGVNIIIPRTADFAYESELCESGGQSFYGGGIYYTDGTKAVCGVDRMEADITNKHVMLLPGGSIDDFYGELKSAVSVRFVLKNGKIRNIEDYYFSNPDSWVFVNGKNVLNIMYENCGCGNPHEASVEFSLNRAGEIGILGDEEEKPSGTPTETPDENPTETPDENPTETPDENPTETPGGNPTETPDENPTETPDEKTTETPDENPTEIPEGTATQVPTAAPTTVSAPQPEKINLTAPSTAKVSVVKGDVVVVSINGIDKSAIKVAGKGGSYNTQTGELTLNGKGTIKLFTLDGKKKKIIAVYKCLEPKMKNLKLKTGKSKAIKLKGFTNVVWMSSDEKIAKVNGGSVSAIAPGTATITAYINGHPFTSTVTVK